MSAKTTQLLSSGEFCKLHYDNIPVKSASANVSFYTNNSKMPNFELWYSRRKWEICSCLVNTFLEFFSMRCSISWASIPLVRSEQTAKRRRRQTALPQKLKLPLDVCVIMANTADRVFTKIENTPLWDSFKGFVWLSPGFVVKCFEMHWEVRFSRSGHQRAVNMVFTDYPIEHMYHLYGFTFSWQCRRRFEAVGMFRYSTGK